MDRRAFIAMAGGSIISRPLVAEAQQPAKVARIGYLSVNLGAAPPRQREAFRQGLRDLGYVEGRDVVIDYRDAGGKIERLAAWLWFTLRREKPTPETGPVCLEYVVDSRPTGEYSRAFFRRTDSS